MLYLTFNPKYVVARLQPKHSSVDCECLELICTDPTAKPHISLTATHPHICVSHNAKHRFAQSHTKAQKHGSAVAKAFV